MDPFTEDEEEDMEAELTLSPSPNLNHPRTISPGTTPLSLPISNTQKDMEAGLTLSPLPTSTILSHQFPLSLSYFLPFSLSSLFFLLAFFNRIKVYLPLLYLICSHTLPYFTTI